MKYFLFALVALVVVLVTALAVVLSEAAEKDREISAKDTRIDSLKRQIETDDFVIAEQKRIIKDPHFRKVIFCPECKSSRYSESLGVYLCGIEEKEERDYCSSGDRKD